MLKVIYSLPRKFKGEDEFRFAKMNINNRQVNFPTSAVKEIILGSSITKSNKNEIIKIVKAKFTTASITQAKYDETLDYVVFNEI